MLEKNHDSFFDENNSEKDQATSDLLSMIDKYEKKVRTDIATGSKVTGTVTRIGSEYAFVDIGTKNEAMIKIIEVKNEDGSLSVNVGDKINAFVISDNASETILSKSIGGASATLGELQEALDNRIPVQGKVTGVNKGGLNVKVLGQRAFCPASQIDLKFTEDLNGYLGKQYDFLITKITEGGRNVVVSRIPLLEKGLESKIEELVKAASEKKIKRGKISRITEFGLFIDMGDLEGLVHVSEVSWERAQNLQESFSVGQDVEFVVLKVEQKSPIRNSKISLSIKQILENPWDQISSRISVGQSIDGKVTRITNFGAFVELMPGVEGLVHISEMSWIKRVHHPSEIVSEGSPVKVTVLGIDTIKKTISLSLKDVSSDPWRDVENRFAVGSEVQGKVSKKARYGYFIDLDEAITGLLVFANISPEKKDSLKEGDEVTVQIESVDKTNRRISLSMGIKEAKQNAADVSKFLQKQSEKSSTIDNSTEFGAALLAALKHKKY